MHGTELAGRAHLRVHRVKREGVHVGRKGVYKYCREVTHKNRAQVWREKKGGASMRKEDGEERGE